MSIEHRYIDKIIITSFSILLNVIEEEFELAPSTYLTDSWENAFPLNLSLNSPTNDFDFN